MNKKIKILFFMDGIGNAGGIQEMVVKWMENIDRSKFQIDILSYNTGKDDNYTERIQALGGNVYIIQTYISKKYFFRSFKELREFFKNHNDYDILHAHSSSKALFIMLYANLFGIKTRILHSHCTQFVMKGKLQLLIANLFKPLTNFLTTDYYACSPEAGIFLFGRNAYDEGQITIAHNGIDVNKYYYNPSMRKLMREKLNIEDKLVIGNVGRFRPQKNHKYLIDIFNEVSKLDSNAILLLVGNGELEGEIKEQVNKLNISDKVKFLGFRSDINDIMQAIDILVMPSIFEGLPVTGVEAQAEGLPCIFADTITKDVAILPESCFMSLNDSPDKWALKIMEKLIGYERKESLEYIKNYGYDIVLETKKLEEFYINKLR